MESFRKFHGRNRYLFHTESPVADLAVEMHVTVIINVTMGVAQFIAYAFTAIVNLMQQMVLFEYGKGAEYPGLVYGINALLKFRHCYGAVTFCQRLQYQQPVGCGLDSVLLQQ